MLLLVRVDVPFQPSVTREDTNTLLHQVNMVTLYSGEMPE
jgi:hypothetical protein